MHEDDYIPHVECLKINRFMDEEDSLPVEKCLNLNHLHG